MFQREVSDQNCVQPDRSEDLLGSLRKQAHANEQLLALSAYFKAVSNETRLRILMAYFDERETARITLNVDPIENRS